MRPGSSGSVGGRKSTRASFWREARRARADCRIAYNRGRRPRIAPRRSSPSRRRRSPCRSDPKGPRGARRKPGGHTMFHHAEPEVLVVGAGPVGLAAALFLQQRGVRVEIIDMHARTSQHSYALAIHPGTLRLLEEAGIAEGLVAAGRKLTRVAYYEGGERRAEIDYGALASKHPYFLVLRQSLLERAAEVALQQKKMKVLWGHRLQALEVQGAGVAAEVAKLDQVATGYPVARSEWVVLK